MEILINYKKKIVARFIPIEGQKALEDLPESDEYIYSEKIDGHIAFAVVADGKVNFYNRSATLLDLPDLAKSFPADKNGIWAGELYLNTERSRSFAVASAIANDKNSLHFAVFDALHELDKQPDERIKIVQKEIVTTDKIHAVKWMQSSSRKELLAKYTEAVANGKEGLVVLNTLGYTYKLKPVAELDVAVLGYGLKEDGSGLRSLLVGVQDGKDWIIVASVGGGFNSEDRVAWLAKLQPLECEADIVLVANNRLAYKWVKPTIVVQIKCIEIINEDSSGTIKKDKLFFDGTNYQSVAKANGVSLISPVFLGVREDKTPGVDDTGINQINTRVEIFKDEVAEVTGVKSEIIFREAYVKESKTGTAVRKFVGLKTNRTLAQNYPPYILYYTDFSAGRKEPLQTDINVAASEEKLRELLEKGKEENIKKGWEKKS